MKLAISSLFILILTTGLNAQVQFENGYYIDLSGRKVKCLIKNSNWSNNPERIAYKLSNNGDVNYFDNKMAKEFGIGDTVKFLLVTAEFPNTYKNPDKSDNDPNPVMTKRTVFVKQILQGEATLFEYRGNNQVSYLYQINNDEPIVLNYKKYVAAGDNKIRENNIFRRQLLKDLKCGNEVDIQTVQYTRKSLISYFRKYNACINPQGIDNSKEIARRKIKTYFKIFGGAQSYGFTFERNNRTVDFGNEIGPKFGVELEGMLPFNTNKWSIFLSVDYSSYSSEEIVSPSSSAVSYRAELNRLGTVLGGRHYMFLNNTNSLFIEGGIAINNDFNAKIDEFIQNEFFDDNEFEVSELSTTGTFGIGYSYKQRMAIRLNYYLNQGILEVDRSDKLSVLALTLVYRL